MSKKLHFLEITPHKLPLSKKFLRLFYSGSCSLTFIVIGAVGLIFFFPVVPSIILAHQEHTVVEMSFVKSRPPVKVVPPVVKTIEKPKEEIIPDAPKPLPEPEEFVEMVRETPVEIDKPEELKEIVEPEVTVSEVTSKVAAFTKAVPHIRNKKPLYPRVAKKRGYSGVVELLVNINANGHVADISIQKSSGYSSLDNAAIKAVKKWVFTPAQEAGRAVESQLELPVRFKLDS